MAFKLTDLKSMADVVGVYYQYLTIEPPPSGHPLSNDEVIQLRGRLDRLFAAYLARKVRLREIEGVWCLLAILSGQRSGMELYLAFEELMNPT